MKTDFFKYFHPPVVVVLAILVATALFFMNVFLGISLSILGIISFVFVGITSYGWKWQWSRRWVKHLFWIDDFSGRYEGVLEYQYIDDKGQLQKGRLKHVKVVNQNGCRITVNSFSMRADGTKSSVSVSRGLHVERTEDENHFRMRYFYQNEGSIDQGFPPHDGTEVIKFIKGKSGKQLSGGYYTNRRPYQTRGEFLELRWVNNNLEHEF